MPDCQKTVMDLTFEECSGELLFQHMLVFHRILTTFNFNTLTDSCQRTQ